ncbi:GNAT family N-acetyltransferase [Vermiculatibacterium agrestimuris]|uniref:GNAT family N-acetyltransferase n=1 Tax=Vermiculatibacterium agrestimuris TaxID=2941519 RepID=UPI0020408E4B|nr:GNAT family N-acetyltransferase [Vermiculatibacterium agrestimuris]
MNERKFLMLSEEELERLYEVHMRRDFPADELKPLSALLAMMGRGEYEPYGLFQDGELLAYALYWRAPGERYVMLDYFAVMPEIRNQGTGSELLRDMLERFCKDGGGVFGEVEIPETGDETVDTLRRRRLGFYARAGLRQMGFRTCIFGVPYLVLAYGPKISDEALMEVTRKLYREAFPDKSFYAKHVIIPWEGGVK